MWPIKKYLYIGEIPELYVDEVRELYVDEIPVWYNVQL